MSHRPATNEDSYLSSGRPSNLLRTSFSSAHLEKLYRASSLQQRRGGFRCFLMSSILYGVYTVMTPGLELTARCIAIGYLNINIVLLVLAECCTHRIISRLWSMMRCCIGQYWVLHMFAQMLFKPGRVTLRDGLAWMLLLLYLLFAALPLKLSRCATLAIYSVLVYFVAVIGLTFTPEESNLLTNPPFDVLVSIREDSSSPSGVPLVRVFFSYIR